MLISLATSIYDFARARTHAPHINNGIIVSAKRLPPHLTPLFLLYIVIFIVGRPDNNKTVIVRVSVARRGLVSDILDTSKPPANSRGGKPFRSSKTIPGFGHHAQSLAQLRQ